MADYIHTDEYGDFLLTKCEDCGRWRENCDEDGVPNNTGGWCRRFNTEAYHDDFCSFEQVWDEVEEKNE